MNGSPMSDADAPMAVSVRGLTKRYDAQVAVDGLTFDVPAGRVVGFIGPNGAPRWCRHRTRSPWESAVAVRLQSVASGELRAGTSVGFVAEVGPPLSLRQVASRGKAGLLLPPIRVEPQFPDALAADQEASAVG
jgi:hypothetical protein